MLTGIDHDSIWIVNVIVIITGYKIGFVTCEADHTAPRVRNYPRVQCTTFRPVFNANMYIV